MNSIKRQARIAGLLYLLASIPAPFALFVIRCGFNPRLLGFLLFISGFANVAKSLTTLVLPDYAPVIDRFAGILAAAELPIILWLLIWGAKEQVVVRARDHDLAAA